MQHTNESPTTDSRFISSACAASHLGVSLPYLKQLVLAGLLPYVPLPNFGKGKRQRRQFDRLDLDNFMNGLKEKELMSDDVVRDALAG